MRRTALLLLAITAVSAAVAARAPAKEGARARLTSALPLDAPAAAVIRVSWSVDAPDAGGGRRPFNAAAVFVQLLSRTGAPPTTGFASEAAHTDGRYAAQVAVPVGGIGGVRIGLRGTTDIFLPLQNDPFRSRAGARCDVQALQTTLAAFVAAYNRGDGRRLDGLFSRNHFAWYSSGSPGGRLGSAAKRRSTLLAYFRARHARADRLILRSLSFQGYELKRQLGHFSLAARRRADDFRGGRWFELGGKGALDCSRATTPIAVLSFGGPA